jgi:REP element-mobilizing transposase RayT
MSIQKTPLEPGKIYHIYNRGINRCNLFSDNDNYEYFLSLYSKHISPIANTLAWVLMKNHLHLLVQILPVEDWKSNTEEFKNSQNMEPNKRTYQQFSNLFNAYTKAYNKRYKRTGSLMEHSFKRKEIDTIDYLKRVIVYIHNNPVKHGFCDHPEEYPWSSYKSCLSNKPTKLAREKVINWFGGVSEFEAYHKSNLNEDDINNWLLSEI